MRPLLIGGLVAVAILAAFFVGMSLTEEQDGPAEQVGESLDQAAEELEEGVENAQ